MNTLKYMAIGWVAFVWIQMVFLFFQWSDSQVLLYFSMGSMVFTTGLWQLALAIEQILTKLNNTPLDIPAFLDKKVTDNA